MVDVIFKIVVIAVLASIATFTFAMAVAVLKEERRRNDVHKRS